MLETVIIATFAATFIQVEMPWLVNYMTEKTTSAKPWGCRTCLAMWVAILIGGLLVANPVQYIAAIGLTYITNHLIKIYEIK